MSGLQPGHSFVICAYKESPYLEECVLSVLRQTVKSTVLIATSTDNHHIRSIAGKYGIEVRFSGKKSDIAGDWNYAYNQAETEYVTIAHQDDLYEPKYAETVIKMMEKREKPLLFFSDYYEIRDGEKVYRNVNLIIKKILLSPMRISLMSGMKTAKKAVLSIGNPICCPSVSYARENLPYAMFTVGMGSNIDWKAWLIAAKMKGDFVYAHRPLVGHRIHNQSTTTQLIEAAARTQEDLEMLRQFWPEPVARIINRVYRNAERSNEV